VFEFARFAEGDGEFAGGGHEAFAADEGDEFKGVELAVSGEVQEDVLVGMGERAMAGFVADGRFGDGVVAGGVGFLLVGFGDFDAVDEEAGRAAGAEAEAVGAEGDKALERGAEGEGDGAILRERFGGVFEGETGEAEGGFGVLVGGGAGGGEFGAGGNIFEDFDADRGFIEEAGGEG